MSPTDGTAGMLLFFPNFAAMIAFGISYYGMAPRATEFCTKYRDLKGITITEGRKNCDFNIRKS